MMPTATAKMGEATNWERTLEPLFHTMRNATVLALRPCSNDALHDGATDKYALVQPIFTLDETVRSTPSRDGARRDAPARGPAVTDGASPDAGARDGQAG